MTASITASQARANLYRLIDEMAESHQPVWISGRRGDAVLIAAEDWQAIQETLCLLAIPGMRESIKQGMAEPLDQSATALDWLAATVGPSSMQSPRSRTQKSLRRPA